MRKIRVLDVSQNIIPAKDPIGPDDYARMVIEESLVWPLQTYNSYVDNSIYQIVQMKTHLKTHIEAPYHLDGKGKPLSAFPPGTFIGRMVIFYFDVSAGTIITKEMIEKADNKRLREGDIVVVRTSWTKKIGGTMPVILQEGGRYFLEKRIKLFGMDESISIFEGVDKSPHDMLLKSNIPLLEMLCNLDQLTQDVSFMIAIPGLMKIEGIDSSTVQAVVLEGLEML
jgi:arylformamidase